MDTPLIFKNMNLSPSRGENESYEEYKLRRTNNNKMLKTYLRMGRLVWHNGMGPYIKSRDGEL
tara:strand:+ start:907 stop:1095 length:189 start_codon:yes stop_codon:yes gene_type:complete